jgi:hypothetical protein
MQLTYYNNLSDKRYVDKNIIQISKEGHANPVDIILIDDTSLAKPTFRMKDIDLYMTANYCYVDSLRRYYFIDDITLSKGFAYLHCTCDVLMTYKEQLRQQNVIVARQEQHWDLYQNDPKWKVSQRTAIRTVAFTGGDGGFDYDTQQFVLGIVGDNT